MNFHGGFKDNDVENQNQSSSWSPIPYGNRGLQFGHLLGRPPTVSYCVQAVMEAWKRQVPATSNLKCHPVMLQQFVP